MKGVNAMKKKINIFVIIIILITCLAGCGGSSTGGGEKAVTNSAILTLLSNYATAVDAYDVDGMLKCLDSSSFKLTINEGSYTDTKDYNTLESELKSDKDGQLAWRKLSSEDPNGHNYKLVLSLGTAYSSNETSTGAVVKQAFEVWESSDEVNPAIKTDSGNIVWTLVQSSGEWRATAMTINYNVSTTAALAVKGLAVTNATVRGFGYSRVVF
jgi:hypothetical protein